MEIKNVEYKDAISIKKMLVNSPSIVDTGKLLPEILEHIEKEDCVHKKIVDGEELLGVWLSKEYPTHTSLSYMFISERLRTTFMVIKFIGECMRLVNPHKPIIITTKDTTGFERYVEKIDDTQYVFKGFR